MKIQQTADEQYFHSAASKIWKTSDLLFAYFFNCTVFIVIQTHGVELQTCFVSTASSYLIFACMQLRKSCGRQMKPECLKRSTKRFATQLQLHIQL